MTTATVTENTIQSPTSFRYCEQIIVQELADVLDHMDETQIDALVNLIATPARSSSSASAASNSHWKPSPNVSPTSAWTR